jgi:hypothetical protein
MIARRSLYIDLIRKAIPGITDEFAIEVEDEIRASCGCLDSMSAKRIMKEARMSAAYLSDIKADIAKLAKQCAPKEVKPMAAKPVGNSSLRDAVEKLKLQMKDKK